MTPLIAGRGWDTFDGYLFDIDGTLLHCTDAVHYFAFCDVLTAVAGRPLDLDGVVAHGNVDIGIMRDALSLAGIPETHWRARLPEMRERLCAHVQQHKHEFCAELLPGVRSVLEHLHQRGAVLGVGTGNLGPVGQAKLEHVGIMDFFAVTGWSDDFEYRADVFREAAATMRQHVGADGPICVLGDTPADIQAAHANGLPVIAVATGIYPKEQLTAAGADLVLSSLAELLPPAG